VSRRLRWGLAAVAATAIGGALLYPAAADWLVTKSGSRIETAGPWRVEGRLVVFKKPDGSLVSLRLSDVDLEGSRDLTREMDERAKKAAEAARPTPATATKRPPVARITDDDVAHVPSADETPKGDEDSTKAQDEKGKSEALQIATWREVGGPGTEGLQFVGNVRNVTDKTALGVTVDVVLSDEAGKELGHGPATLSSTALPPGQSATFHTSFPGVFAYSKVEFKTGGQLVEVSGRGTSPSGNGDEAPPASGSGSHR
jgi:hypothetical protein